MVTAVSSTDNDANGRGTQLASICIAFIDMPRVLREIVDDTLARQPRIGLVDETKYDGSLIAAADRGSAECLIVSSDSVGATEVCQLLDQRPHMRVLAIDGTGRDGCLSELRPNLAFVGQLSLHRLIQTVLRGVPREPNELNPHSNGR